ncbi:MAG: hypothetical protein ACK5Y2_12370 [Bdellovibrionales bacterium]
MKSRALRRRSLPFFVFLAFLSTATFFSPATWAETAKSCQSVLGTDFVRLTPGVEPVLNYAPGQPFKMRGMTQNMKDLFYSSRELVPGTGIQPVAGGEREAKPKTRQKDKPEYQVRAIQKILIEQRPLWLAAQELGGREGGESVLNHPELQNRYHLFHEPGNDSRGIDVGIYVSRALPFQFRYVSHKHLRWTDRWIQDGKPRELELPLFSRDFGVLLFFAPDAKPDSKPLMALGVLHNKSKRHRDDSKGRVIDHEGSRLRTAQHEGIAKIIEDYKALYGEDFPFIIAGDFNTEVQTSKELGPVRQLTKSVFDIEEGDPDAPHERGTHAYFPRGKRPERDQIDDIRVSGQGVRIIEAQALDYVDGSGRRTEWPKNFDEREKQHSDHKAVVVDMILK